MTVHVMVSAGNMGTYLLDVCIVRCDEVLGPRPWHWKMGGNPRWGM